MSYEVKITAATLSELSGKLLAMGSQLSIPPETGLERTISAIMPEVAAMTPEKSATARRAKDAGKAEEASEQNAASEATVEDGESIEDSTAGTTTSSSGSTTTSTATKGASPSDAEPLNFEKDIAPRVLAVVQAKGKPVMQEILSEFGVERASQIPADVLAEFVEVLDKELAA